MPIISTSPHVNRKWSLRSARAIDTRRPSTMSHSIPLKPRLLRFKGDLINLCSRIPHPTHHARTHLQAIPNIYVEYYFCPFFSPLRTPRNRSTVHARVHGVKRLQRQAVARKFAPQELYFELSKTRTTRTTYTYATMNAGTN